MSLQVPPNCKRYTMPRRIAEESSNKRAQASCSLVAVWEFVASPTSLLLIFHKSFRSCDDLYDELFSLGGEQVASAKFHELPIQKCSCDMNLSNLLSATYMKSLPFRLEVAFTRVLPHHHQMLPCVVDSSCSAMCHVRPNAAYDRIRRHSFSVVQTRCIIIVCDHVSSSLSEVETNNILTTVKTNTHQHPVSAIAFYDGCLSYSPTWDCQIVCTHGGMRYHMEKAKRNCKCWSVPKSPAPDFSSATCKRTLID